MQTVSIMQCFVNVMSDFIYLLLIRIVDTSGMMPYKLLLLVPMLTCQDFILSIEMIIFGILMNLAFSWTSPQIVED